MKRIKKQFLYAVTWVLILSFGISAKPLVPVGQVIGLELSEGIVTVAAFDETFSAAREAGIKIGDRICSVDGHAVSSGIEVQDALRRSGGSVRLIVNRGGREQEFYMEPDITPEGPKLGVYLRQGITGIGTVTWYDPESRAFGTLGHGVSDRKGSLLTMERGRAYPADVISVRRGQIGNPGQLRGSLDSGAMIGSLSRNTAHGVFGISSAGWEGHIMETAEYGQVHTGQACIRSTVDRRGPRDYSVEILKIYPEDREDGRNFLLKVTDPALLEATGGIVQGMSGSPIIQDGRLIGAVTHVLVQSPTTGYGIFIENMLDAG